MPAIKSRSKKAAPAKSKTKPITPADPLSQAISAGNITVKPAGPETGQEKKPIVEKDLKLDIPGAGDHEALDKIDKFPESKKIPAAPKPEFDLSIVKAIKAMLIINNEILKSRKSKWALTDAEVNALVETIPPVFDKYGSKFAQYLPEVALGNVILSIVVTRLDLKKLMPGLSQ